MLGVRPWRWVLVVALAAAGQAILAPAGPAGGTPRPPGASGHSSGAGERPGTGSVPDYLGGAATRLEAGDPVTACLYLARHVEAYPDDTQARDFYAELLVRLGKPELARLHLARCVSAAQQGGEKTLPERIHWHTRLAEVAEVVGDEYAGRLHRGIGLYLLALRRLSLPEPAGDLPAEQLHCKASAELALARLLRPDEARPCWYLYLVWGKLGQSRSAARHLAEAAQLAPLSDLTPGERRDLMLAVLARDVRR